MDECDWLTERFVEKTPAGSGLLHARLVERGRGFPLGDRGRLGQADTSGVANLGDGRPSWGMSGWTSCAQVETHHGSAGESVAIRRLPPRA